MSLILTGALPGTQHCGGKGTLQEHICKYVSARGKWDKEGGLRRWTWFNEPGEGTISILMFINFSLLSFAAITIFC